MDLENSHEEMEIIILEILLMAGRRNLDFINIYQVTHTRDNL
jgi:hypothetical protein